MDIWCDMKFAILFCKLSLISALWWVHFSNVMFNTILQSYNINKKQAKCTMPVSLCQAVIKYTLHYVRLLYNWSSRHFTLPMVNFWCNSSETSNCVYDTTFFSVTNFHTDQMNEKSGPCCCLFVGWLANVPATCECISETDLLRQFYVLPHWDRSCRSNFPSHTVTVYWNWANQSQHWPYNARHLAG